MSFCNKVALLTKQILGALFTWEQKKKKIPKFTTPFNKAGFMLSTQNTQILAIIGDNHEISNISTMGTG